MNTKHAQCTCYTHSAGNQTLYIWVFLLQAARTIALSFWAHLWSCCLGNASQLYANNLHLNTACMEALWGEWLFSRTICTMTLLRDFFQPNPHPAGLFSCFGCIYQPTSFCSHWTNLPRKLLEVTSQIVWHIQCMLKHLKLHASYADIGGLSWY